MYKLKRKLKKSVKHIVILFFSLLLMYPLLWMISASFKPDIEIFTGLSFLPENPTLMNYIYGWGGVSGVTFGRFFANSFFIAILAIIGNTMSCAMAAFAFAKLEFRLRPMLFALMLVTLMLPFHVTLIPQYIVFNQLGWINSYLPLIVPRFFAVDGFFVFLLVQFMRTISNELLEAPRIDGCNNFRIYLSFILPLSVPALVTVSIFTFIWTWNDFFSQMVYLSSPHLFTVSLALRNFVDATGTSSWGALFAMSTMSLVPLFLMFIIFQSYLIEGIQTGSLKG